MAVGRFTDNSVMFIVLLFIWLLIHMVIFLYYYIIKLSGEYDKKKEPSGSFFFANYYLQLHCPCRQGNHKARKQQANPNGLQNRSFFTGAAFCIVFPPSNQSFLLHCKLQLVFLQFHQHLIAGFDFPFQHLLGQLVFDH